MRKFRAKDTNDRSPTFLITKYLRVKTTQRICGFISACRRFCGIERSVFKMKSGSRKWTRKSSVAKHCVSATISSGTVLIGRCVGRLRIVPFLGCAFPRKFIQLEQAARLHKLVERCTGGFLFVQPLRIALFSSSAFGVFNVNFKLAEVILMV